MTPEALSLNLPELAEPFSWNERSGIPVLEAVLPGARAAFSTRLGGESDGPEDESRLQAS